ncbi:carboxypeptidase-like regulatory domain-containing protein [Joostella sp. CR20]|uniref:carboxypeptidase-like regulatory domain-containing protein n=1 Tax=Joostella sp. CR20 TaxID=2804312 RepID=UPI00313D3C5A
MKHLYFFLFCYLSSMSLFSQHTFEGKIIDSVSKEPIPFATVSLNNENGVISTETGDFVLNVDQDFKPTDSIFISCLGFKEKHFSALNFSAEVIALEVNEIELDEVIVLNKTYTVDEIIEKVQDSLNKNYDTDFVEQRMFFRTSDYTNVLDKNVKIKESSIPEINQQFTDSILSALPNKSSYHTEILADMYVKLEEENQQLKLAIVRASELYDKNNELSFKGVEEKLQRIMRKHVKRDSYFKIKSGIIGAKSDIDSSFFEDESLDTLVAHQQEKEQKRKENFLKYRTGYLQNVLRKNFVYEDSDLNFIHKDRKYDFNLDDVVYVNRNLVYKISFQPSGGADFKGVMYVNADDFAVIRLDYENVKPLKKVNLFGISYLDYLLKGTFLYEKNARGKYSLKYVEETSAEKIGFDRPLSIIEKNKNVKGRRKQNEVATHVDFTLENVIKNELVVFNTENLSEETFENFTPEPNIIPTYLPNYDASFWEGYNILPPNEAIKKFKSLDE